MAVAVAVAVAVTVSKSTAGEESAAAAEATPPRSCSPRPRRRLVGVTLARPDGKPIARAACVGRAARVPRNCHRPVQPEQPLQRRRPCASPAGPGSELPRPRLLRGLQESKPSRGGHRTGSAARSVPEWVDEVDGVDGCGVRDGGPPRRGKHRNRCDTRVNLGVRV